jgi:UDP-glucose 4-epimerase
VDNFVNSSPESLKRIRSIVGAEQSRHLEFVQADVTDFEAMQNVFHTYGKYIKSVIHFCGLKAVSDR